MSAHLDGRDGLSRPRSRGLPRPRQLHAKVTTELFGWVQRVSRAAGITASQWLFDMVQTARERARLSLPRADAAGVTLLATGERVELLLRPVATSDALELVLRAGALSLSLPLDARHLRRVAAVLEEAAARLPESAADVDSDDSTPQEEVADPIEDDETGPTGGRSPTTYFLTPAPGFYGDTTTVLSSHRIRARAVRAADLLNQQAGRGRFVVRLGTLRKGDHWVPDYESRYPQHWP